MLRSNGTLTLTRRAPRAFLAGICLLGFGVAATAQGAETALLALWERHLDAPDDPLVIARDARDWLNDHAGTAWAPMVRTLMGWRLLQAGQRQEAAQVLESVAAVTRDHPVDRAAVSMARRWLTRLDRERVREALKAHFAREVAYPATLDALRLPSDKPAPPRVDRFGAPWGYRLEPFSRISGLASHRYRLQSRALGETSDLIEALRRPYPAADAVRIRRQVSQRPLAIEFEITLPDQPPETVTLAEGGRSGGLRFVTRGAGFALLTDQDDYWLVVRPERRDGYGALP